MDHERLAVSADLEEPAPAAGDFARELSLLRDPGLW
jgi:hypothetical protein